MRAPEFFFLQDSIFFKFIVWLLFGINFNKLMLLPLWQGLGLCTPMSADMIQYSWERTNLRRVQLLSPLQQTQLSGLLEHTGVRPGHTPC